MDVTTPTDHLSPTARRGQDIFERDIAPALGDAPPHAYVAIEVNTGDFEVGLDKTNAIQTLRSRHVTPEVWVRRVATIYTFKLRRPWKTAT